MYIHVYVLFEEARFVGWHYLSKDLSKTASLVFYSVTSLMRLLEFDAFFTTLEEHLRETSSVRQVAPPDMRPTRATDDNSYHY